MPRRLTRQQAIRVTMVVLLLLVLVFLSLLRSTYSVDTPGEEITFTELSRAATNGQVTRAALLEKDGRIVGTRCVPRPSGQPPARPPSPTTAPAAPGTAACNGNLSAFHADYPRSEVIVQQLIQSITRGGAPLTIDRQRGDDLAKLFLTAILPLAILATFSALVAMARRSGRSLVDIAGLRRSSGEKHAKAAAGGDVTFADVAGADDAVAMLREASVYLADPTKFEGYGGAAPRGVLLFGPAGCGKTLLARAVAGQSKVPFLSISAIEPDVGPDGLGKLFEQARNVAPAVVFVDEMDVLVPPGVNQLLTELDRMGAAPGIVVVGATSRPESLDPVLLGAGRLDRLVAVSLPDLNGRKAILRIHGQKRLMARGVDLEEAAAATAGLTGADLSQIIDRAAWLARDDSGAEITSDHLSAAVRGPWSGRVLGADDRERMAYHHAGHAVVQAAFGKRDQVERVSILGDGHGLGEGGPPHPRQHLVLNTEETEGRLAVAMAGISAEQLRFGTTSTAAEDDIESATGLAREMVGRYGMAPKLGRVRAADDNTGWSERTRKDFDDEVKRLIRVAEQRATAVLSDHRSQLDKLAGLLKDAETLKGAPLQALLVSVQDRSDLLRDH